VSERRLPAHTSSLALARTPDLTLPVSDTRPHTATSTTPTGYTAENVTLPRSACRAKHPGTEWVNHGQLRGRSP
jgi:hypothetical protein